MPEPIFVQKASATVQCVIAALLLLLIPHVSIAQPDRQPVPNRADQQEAVERIKEIFPDEYKTNDKAALTKFAKQLLELGRVEKDAVSQFALYREAVRLASENGEVQTSMSAIDAMEGAFQLNATAVTAYALTNLNKSVLGREASHAFIDQCERFATVLIDEDEFDQAKKILGYAFTISRKIRDNDRAVAVRGMAEQIDDIAKAFRKVKEHAATLKQNPDDPTANLELGRYACFIKGDWEKGLPRLAKGGDPALKALAEKTLAGAADAKAKYEIASGWWQQGVKLEAVERGRVQSYASRWYQEAVPGLSGLAKVTAEKRLAEVAPSSDGGGSAPTRRGPKTIDLLATVDPKNDFKSGGKWSMANGALICTRGSFVPKFTFQYQPPEEYDVTFTFAQAKLGKSVGVILPKPNGGAFALHVGGDGGRAVSISAENNKYKRSFPRPFIQEGVKYRVVLKVRKQNLQATINGTPVVNLPTNYTDLKLGSWHRVNDPSKVTVFCDDPMTYYEVKITEVTGEGALTRFPMNE